MKITQDDAYQEEHLAVQREDLPASAIIRLEDAAFPVAS
jgi:hypothetical protein